MFTSVRVIKESGDIWKTGATETAIPCECIVVLLSLITLLLLLFWCCGKTNICTYVSDTVCSKLRRVLWWFEWYLSPPEVKLKSGSQCNSVKRQQSWTGEWFSTEDPLALTEYTSSVPSTQVRQLTTICKSNSSQCSILF